MMLRKKEQDGDAAGGYNPTFKKDNPPPTEHPNLPQSYKLQESHK
jgi:hypothetical protein